MAASHRTLVELYTPENVNRAARLNLSSSNRSKLGLPTRIIRELLAVKLLHPLVAEGYARVAYGVTLPSDQRRWSTFLQGVIVELRAKLDAEAAAAFFVLHLVCPVAAQLPTEDRLRLVAEMRTLSFTDDGKRLGEFPTAALILDRIKASK